MMGPTQSEVTAFLEEGRKTQRLKGHKNIVEVYDTFQEGSDAFIVMEFVEGSSLDAIFKERAFKDGWIATDEALDYFRQILEGLVFAHSGGLLHRDVKPSNILLSKLGVIKVVDFGLAKPMPFGKSISTHVAPGFAGTGTQPYMSFEQANGKEVDQQSDIFSAGIVGYILFSGSHPFNHPSAAHPIVELIKEVRFNCKDLAPRLDLPENVRKAVMRMLRKEKAERYHSIYEPLAELTRANLAVCSECSSSNPVGSNFCNQCGKNLKAPVAPKAAATERVALSAAELTDEGFELTKTGRWEDAIAKYQEAIKLNPKYGRAFSNLGFALNKIGDHDRAIEFLMRGIDVTSDENILHRLHDTLGFALSNLKRFDEAIDSFGEAITLNPNNPRPLYHRAESKAQMANYKPQDSLDRKLIYRSALDDVEGVLSLDPEFFPALRLRDRLVANLGFGR